MYLRSGKKMMSKKLSIDDKVHKKSVAKIQILKNVLAKEIMIKNAINGTNEKVTNSDDAMISKLNKTEPVKSNTNEKISYSIKLNPKMDLITMIKTYNKNLLFFKKQLALKMQIKEDVARLENMNTIEITNFETMSFVCPELDFWKNQF